MPLAAPAGRRSRSTARKSVTIGPAAIACADSGRTCSYELLKVNLQGVEAERARRVHVSRDTLDMDASRQRAAFIKQAAHELGVKEETIRRDLGQRGPCMEDLQRRADQARRSSRRKRNLHDAEEEAAAMELLRDPRLLDRVLEDFEQMRRGGRGDEQARCVSGARCRGCWKSRWPSWCSRHPLRARVR